MIMVLRSKLLLAVSEAILYVHIQNAVVKSILALDVEDMFSYRSKLVLSCDSYDLPSLLEVLA